MDFAFNVIRSSTTFYPKIPLTAYLREDNWDDHSKFQTQFYLTLIDEEGLEHEIGSVKIAYRGLKPGRQVARGVRKPELEPVFPYLSRDYFSLGQEETYYEALNKLGEDARRSILTALRDCAFDLGIYEEFIDEPAMSVSLTRDFSENRLQHRLARLAQGNTALTQFEFEYLPPDPVEEVLHWERPILSFAVEPLSTPPTNIHVVIGRNGVGKTSLLKSMACSLLQPEANSRFGVINQVGPQRHHWGFAGLVFVSFSAFDSFKLPAAADSKIRAHQVNLNEDPEVAQLAKPAEILNGDFLSAFKKCIQGPRKGRWHRAIKTLETDPLFEDAGIAATAELPRDRALEQATAIFNDLSSGHKIVLLAICKLVEMVEEATLVLIDEPETHLHPPLLSAFIRSLADLLLDRNGVAIIATHSPVVLQEVPMSCAWLITRSGPHSSAERPSIETFGENVGTLTREVFKLEVTDSGFHNLLRTEVNRQEHLSFAEIVEKFGGQLGGEARAILRGLISERDGRESL